MLASRFMVEIYTTRVISNLKSDPIEKYGRFLRTRDNVHTPERLLTVSEHRY
jgi:hypothetical protein